MNHSQEHQIEQLEQQLAAATKLCDAFVFAMSGNPIEGLGTIFVNQNTGKISRSKAIENIFKTQDGNTTIMEGDVENSDLLTIFPEFLEHCEYPEVYVQEVQQIPGQLQLLEEDHDPDEPDVIEQVLSPTQRVLRWLCERSVEKKNLVVGNREIIIQHRSGLTRELKLPQRTIKVYGVHVAAEEYMIVIHDETPLEQKNNELQAALQQLKLAQTQLIQSEKMAALGELVAGVAHEINTPISIGLIASSYLLEREEFIPFDYIPKGKEQDFSNEELEKIMKVLHEEQQEDFFTALADYLLSVWHSAHMIYVNMNRASTLIKSFKTLSTNQFVEDCQNFSVRAYLQEVILIGLKPALKPTKISMNITFHNDQDILMNSYPGAFGQVIINLIMNSKNHAFDPETPGKIDLNFQKEGDYLLLTYQDDGKGVDPAIISKIFDPFFTTKRGLGGTGLGLSISYNLVTQQLGGMIRCESVIGSHTIFHIRLPLSNEREAEEVDSAS